MPLLAIPNFSEGRDRATIDALGEALAGGRDVRLLDVHTDPDHNRAVYTLSGVPAGLVDALLAGAAEAAVRIDITTQRGEHPRVGALDVAPIVYMSESQRGVACAAALTLADRLATECEIPVFLYGELTGGTVSRARVRSGGHTSLQRRLDAGELRPDYGPPRLHPRAGAVLVGARPPLIAFNVELAAPARPETARLIAAAIREGAPEGLRRVRAMGVSLDHRGGIAQISTNLEDYHLTSPAAVVAAVAEHARALGARVAGAEIVGLPPRAAFADFPDAVPLANARFLEDALGVPG